MYSIRLLLSMIQETSVTSFASFMEALHGSAVQEYVTPMSVREWGQTDLMEEEDPES